MLLAAILLLLDEMPRDFFKELAVFTILDPTIVNEIGHTGVSGVSAMAARIGFKST